MMPFEHDDIEAWHIDRQGLSACETAPADAMPDALAPGDLPLVVREPTRVRFGDQALLLDQQGLYMFHDRGRLRWSDPDALPTVQQQRHNDASVILFQDDVNTLFAGLATLHVHGWVHADFDMEARLAWMKRGLLSCTCGTIAQVGVHLLTSFGYGARMVSGLRVRGPYDARDNGHMLFEYFDPQLGRWVLVDLDTHSCFAWQGQPLSLGDVADCIHRGQRFEIVPLTPPGFAIPDTTGYVAPQTGTTYMTFKLLSEPHLRQWFELVLEVPVIEADGRRWFWHPDDDLAQRAASYAQGAERLGREQWLSRFYGDNLTASATGITTDTTGNQS
ncbi:hypothetical protein ACERK3_14800 [Phycisphaerales bacterium AB-hyl4]|uniref:Transglutaminase-like domain-containing protein n=1 Tax=Natronomicrosphaera hydrolytica TaxID=3242702 RepID=A0ABV4U7R6_9BACT